MHAASHYIFLDGLRGIAALAVQVFTLAVFDAPLWFPHATLAVDFFFCLSGFVVAHAFEGRLLNGRMSVVEFARARFNRLYPFLAGVAISRLGLARGGQMLPAFATALALVVLLFNPKIGAPSLYDAALIIVGFPAIVICGARVQAGPRLSRVSSALGALSYPLYALHYLVGLHEVEHHALHLNSPLLLAAIGVALSLPTAWVALKCYDEPVRSALRKFKTPLVLAPAASD